MCIFQVVDLGKILRTKSHQSVYNLENIYVGLFVSWRHPIPLVIIAFAWIAILLKWNLIPDLTMCTCQKVPTYVTMCTDYTLYIYDVRRWYVISLWLGAPIIYQTFHWGWLLAFEWGAVIARTQRHTDKKDTEPIIYRSQQFDTRSSLRASKIKGVVTVYNKTIQRSCFILSYLLWTLIDNIFCKLLPCTQEHCSGILIKKLSDHQPCSMLMNSQTHKKHHHGDYKQRSRRGIVTLVIV